MIAASLVPDLNGLSETEALAHLDSAGFVFRHVTQGGYREFRHADGSRIWIRPDGEVIRLGPKVPGRKYRSRYDARGVLTEEHSTGEKIVLGH